LRANPSPSADRITLRELVIFGMLAALMYASKVIMDALPNIHLLAVFVVAITVVYRKKALYPLYTFVLLVGILNGFDLWWIPYLYIWTILWAAVMLLPRNLPPKMAPIVYMAVASLHGFLYGVLYAPFQALAFGLSLEGTIAWLISGIPFDIIHGISNLFCGLLILPLVKVLKNADRMFR